MPTHEEMVALQQRLQQRAAQGEVIPGKLQLDQAAQAARIAFEREQTRLYFHTLSARQQLRIRVRLYLIRTGVPLLVLITYGIVIYIATTGTYWHGQVPWSVRLFTFLILYPWIRSWWRHHAPWWGSKPKIGVIASNDAVYVESGKGLQREKGMREVSRAVYQVFLEDLDSEAAGGYQNDMRPGGMTELLQIHSQDLPPAITNMATIPLAHVTAV